LFLFLFLVFASPTFAANGYLETATRWNEVVRNANKSSLTLQNLYANVEAQVGPDKSKLRQAFTKSLAQQYPGSNYYGTVGTLALNNYTYLTFDSSWEIVIVRQNFGSLTQSYDFRNLTVEIANGPNRVKFKIDPRNLEDSRFTLVDIPAISVTANRIWAKKGRKQGLGQPLADLLNDAYSLRIASTDGISMDKLAEGLVGEDATRQYVLNVADALYSNRTAKAVPSTRVAESATPVPRVDQPPSTRSPTFNPFKAVPGYLFLILLGILIFKGWSGSGRRKRLSASREDPVDFSWDGRSLSGKTSSLNRPSISAPETETSRSQWGWSSDDSLPQAWTRQVLGSLEWKRFENVCAEYLRLTGYEPKETRIGADGGVDIRIYKPGIEKSVGIVQCKAWNTYKVGVKPVRELFGVMAAEGVDLGLFMTSGEFTSEAKAFAEGKPLELISGGKLLAEIGKLPADQQSRLLRMALDGDYRTPTCPQCGVKMTLRQGQGSRSKFWGCPIYPRCRATLVYKPEAA
jgi:restriction system protein